MPRRPNGQSIAWPPKSKCPSLPFEVDVVYAIARDGVAQRTPCLTKEESLYSSNQRRRHRRESGKSKGCGQTESRPIPKQAFAGSNPVTRSQSRMQGHLASDKEANIEIETFNRRVRGHALAILVPRFASPMMSSCSRVGQWDSHRPHRRIGARFPGGMGL